MRYKTMFRLLLKVVGVLVIVNHFPTLLYYLSAIIRATTDTASAGRGWGAGLGATMLGAIPIALQYAAATYLFFDGGWVVSRVFRRNPPICSECGEDLTVAAQDICPFCGEPFELEDAPA